MIETPYAVTPSDNRKPPEPQPPSHVRARLPDAKFVCSVEPCVRCGDAPTISLSSRLVWCQTCTDAGRLPEVFLGGIAGVIDWNDAQRVLRRERSRQRRAAAWVTLALLLVVVAIVRWRAGGAA